MNDDIYTISELNNFIKDVVNAGFPQGLWICGEIQGYNRNRDKRHVFFELVEKEKSSKDIKARIGLVIFAGVKPQIEALLKKSENAFALKDDIEVKFLCRVDFYAPHGAVRLIVENIDPTYTLGKIAQEKQRLIADLTKKGILNKNKELAMPVVPLRIGLITSYDSAAYNDFCSELKRSGFHFQIYSRNALMQGQKAEKDIVNAIDECIKVKDLDVLVITRGGGSISDLSCFDSEAIARQIALAPLPVLSGIGHEINITITDLAANQHAKTPTAIAQVLVGFVENYIESLNRRLEDIMQESTDQLADHKNRLKDVAVSLQQGTTDFLKSHHERIISFRESLRHASQNTLTNKRQNLYNRWDQLKTKSSQAIKDAHALLERSERIIDIVHPQKTLKRGFSITRSQKGKLIKTGKEVKSGDIITTEFSDGLLNSQVKK